MYSKDLFGILGTKSSKNVRLCYLNSGQSQPITEDEVPSLINRCTIILIRADSEFCFVSHNHILNFWKEDTHFKAEKNSYFLTDLC